MTIKQKEREYVQTMEYVNDLEEELFNVKINAF